MALPWLIGAAVVGVVGVIAKAVSDDTPSSSSYSDDSAAEERRLRQKAAKEREEQERKQKSDYAQRVFAETGASYGQDLIDALQGGVEIESAEHGFRSRLEHKGFTVPDVAENGAASVMDLLHRALPAPDANTTTTLENLAFYGRLYDVQLKASTRMRRRATEIEQIDKQQAELADMKVRLRQLENELAASGA